MKKFEEKYPFVWLFLGLILTILSYGIFNTFICAWIFAIPLLRYINIRTKWSSIIFMLIGMVIAANITFFRLVRDEPHIMNHVYGALNGVRIWFPFFVYFLCRKFKARPTIAYLAFPAAVAVAEFFIDNPFVSVMTTLAVSQFWNIGLMQLASVTGVVGVSFVVTLFASIVNHMWEVGIKKSTIINAIIYGIFIVIVTGIGMTSVKRITTSDNTVRVATSVENVNLLVKNQELLDSYSGSFDEKMMQYNLDLLDRRAKEAAYNDSSLLVFPEEAFLCSKTSAESFIAKVQDIAKENKMNIVLPLLKMPTQENEKQINTLNFINSNGELENTYVKNNLVPVLEEPVTEKGDGKTPIFEIDGIKFAYLICADYTSNELAYNGREADILVNPSYDWKSFQYFTSYGIQARAIECGFSVLRNPVNGNIILYDYYGRPLHMSNAMGVHEGVMYLDVPKEGRTTIYGATGNWFPWACAAFSVFAIVSGFIIKKKETE